VFVLDHAFVKKGAAVPPAEIERAMRRRARFKNNPAAHTFRGELQYG